MLELRDVEVAYGQARALWGVSLRLGAGELLCVVGPNGAGKTTLINAIAGVLRARAGTIWFDGRDVTALPPHRFCEAGIALVPEGRRLFTGMSVRENLELGSYLPAARRQRQASLDTVLDLFPVLREKLASPAGELSGGQQQMVAIGRGLMARPRLLLLDEVLCGLTPSEIDDAVALIRRIRDQGSTIVFVEHVMRAVMALTDRVVVLNHGLLLAEGPAAEVMQRPEVMTAYLGPAHA